MSAEYKQAVEVYLAAKARREEVEALLRRVTPGTPAGYRIYDALKHAERVEADARRVMHNTPGGPARG